MMQVNFATGLSPQIADWLRTEVQRFSEVRAAYLLDRALGATTARSLTLTSR